ncbi:MAG: chorismate mutase [Alphaproteobacteria bacterium]|nr:chorismate mutase [Alphaproteobacteria bacterium]
MSGRAGESGEGAGSSLEALRGEIDSIDTAIHELIMKRASLQDRVAAAKAREGAPAGYMRPGREAQILRRIAAAHRGPYPLDVVMRVWRELISAGLGVQRPFRVEVLGEEGSLELWDLARAHFGGGVGMRLAHGGQSGLLLHLAAEPGTVGIVPAPHPQGDDRPWWAALVSDDPGRPRVIARLPFFREADAGGRGGFALCAIPLDPSGADTSLVVVRGPESGTPARLTEMAAAAGIEGETLSMAREPGGARSLLLACPGFLDPADPRLAEARAHGLLGLHLIGAYADPILYRR